MRVVKKGNKNTKI